MSALVVALQVKGRRCLVLGGGAEALSKSRRLTDAGARVTVVAPALDAELRDMVERGEIDWAPRDFDPSLDLDARPFVVVSAIEDLSRRVAVRASCAAAGSLLCCVDAPQHCDFFFTAQGDCGPMTLAIASEGKAPLLARVLRDELVRQLDAPLRLLGDALVALRNRCPPAERRARLSKALEGFGVEIRVRLPNALLRDDDA